MAAAVLRGREVVTSVDGEDGEEQFRGWRHFSCRAMVDAVGSRWEVDGGTLRVLKVAGKGGTIVQQPGSVRTRGSCAGDELTFDRLGGSDVREWLDSGGVFDVIVFSSGRCLRLKPKRILAGVLRRDPALVLRIGKRSPSRGCSGASGGVQRGRRASVPLG